MAGKNARRELVFHTRTNPSAIIYDMAKCTPDIWMQEKDDWHFREVILGERSFTREELKAAFDRAYDPDSLIDITAFYKDIEAELWPDGVRE